VTRGALYVMRGLPGSGKSTLARTLVGPEGLVASADDWHVGADGAYRYRVDEAGVAHAWNQLRVREAMRAGVPRVAADCTNVTLAHLTPYVRAAAEHGYRVHVVEVPCALTDEELARRTVHAVPVEAIRKMRAAWEPLP